VKDSCWLIMTAKGVTRMAKGVTRGRSRWERSRPALKAGEYAVFISVEVPDAAFKPAPLPTATIKVTEASLITPSASVEVLEPLPLEQDPDYVAGRAEETPN
jgi:hypothetical protein